MKYLPIFADMIRAKIIGISRHRLATDGDGVTTLVAFQGCPLRCRYCLNPQSLDYERNFRTVTPRELYDETRIDELYFLATGGGVTFGGGEPGLQPAFITEFRRLCGPQWKIVLETSLNIQAENLEALLGVADGLIIDIKDLDPDVYEAYTGRTNSRVLENLKTIAGKGRQADCLVRLPLIPHYNSDDDRAASRAFLESLGYGRFDLFTYKTDFTNGPRKRHMQDS